MQRQEEVSSGTITDQLVYQITDVATGNPRIGGYDGNGNAQPGGLYFKEDIVRNSNTLPGDPSLTGWNVLFGQFFDHGLDFIGKGGNRVLAGSPGSRIIIPLDPSDPLYSPNNQSLSLSRATVLNPEAAGPDGMFRTADDILSPGPDRLYGTADDVLGPTNPSFANSTSPYIDQSQTYGSSDDVTQVLREWVKDPASGKFVPGMRLFNGSTLAQPWQRPNPDGSVVSTTQTLPTLNELRAYILSTGRDDLSWEDIGNLRARDASGKVLDLSPAAGLQPKLTGQSLVADMLPRLDAAHLFTGATVLALKATPGYVDPLAGFSGVDRGADGNTTNKYVSDYINLQSGQPTPLGSATDPTTRAIVGEILLRGIGDHYVAGDGRVNENFGLTAIHHVWHENHNWQVDNLLLRIGQEQALDPVRASARQWQTAIINPSTNQPYTDIKGNYTNSTGVISWNQEKLFQAALLINQMEYQHVAIDQYARGMSPNIPIFVMYDSSVNADVTLEYSQAAFRFGHSQIREVIDALDPNGSLTAAVTHYALDQGFLNPASFAEVGPTAIALGMTRQLANELDQFITPALQQRLLGQPQDLAAINIARGRDLGITTLNNLRRALSGGMQTQLLDLQTKLATNPSDSTLRQTYDKTIAIKASLAPYTSWSSFANGLQYRESVADFIAAYALDGNIDAGRAIFELGINGKSWANLSVNQQNAVSTLATPGGPLAGWTPGNAKSQASLFVSPAGNNGYENIDAWSGGIAEKHVFLGQMGPTFDAIFCDQMTRLINGDRQYYFWRLQDGLINATQLIESIVTEQFKDVIERTTGARHLVGDVFFYADSYIELGENPVNTGSGENRDHKYGDLASSLKIGVYSDFGGDTSSNGLTTTINGVSYIIDSRPDSSVLNPDGTPSSGFNSHEVISGTAFADWLNAGDGDDTEYADNGDDVLIGGPGADHLYGEAGNDSIFGDSLPDFLDGGDGNDLIEGGDDTDVLIGGEGNDSIYGGSAIDELHGDNGDDFLDGGAEGDFIFGGRGQDLATGGENVDVVDGEWGDDILFGGDGPDQLFGGDGDDVLHGGTGAGNLTLNVDECLGEAGFDLVSFSDILLKLDAIADLNFQNVNQVGPATSLVTPFGQLWVLVEGVEGGLNSDQIIGDAQDNWLIGGDNNDLFTGGAGDDVIIGDAFRLDKLNSLVASKHFVELLKSFPDYTLGLNTSLLNGSLQSAPSTAGSADTVTYSGPSSNFIVTPIFDPPNSNTRIGLRLIDKTGRETGPNGDILIGVEKLVFGFDFAATVATGPNAHKPIDPATLPAVTSFNTSDLQTNPYLIQPLVVQGYAASTSTSALQPANPGVNNLYTNITQRLTDFHITSPPTISWQSKGPSIFSNWTTIAAATGAAYTIPSSGFAQGTQFRQLVTYLDANGVSRSLTTAASAGMGQIQTGTATANTLSGTQYQDVIYGLAGNDNLSGGTGDDYIDGGANADILDGGAGLDQLLGGSGNDLYILSNATHHSAAEIRDTDTTAGNVDEVRFTSTTAAQTLTLFAGDLGIERVVIGTGTGATAVTSGITALNVNAGAVLNGLTIVGNAGANILTGTGFADNVSGAAGVDAIDAGDGDDTITGSSGLDRLTGGLGNDLFQLGALTEATPGGTSTARSFESITDFAIGADRLDAPFSTAAAPRAVKILGSVNALSDAAIGGLLNGSSAGQPNFATNGAAVFTFVTGGAAQTYLALNDGTAAYSAASDAILEITGYTGNLAQLTVI